MAEKILTAALLRELLAYDADTGVFTRRVPLQGVKVGDVAGGDSCDGYTRTRLLGRPYLAHRLAWLYVHGEWPAGQIDHIDGRRNNNRLANLRDVSKSANMQNQRRAQSSSTHGFMGVARNGNRWQSQIKVDGKRRYLGTHDTPELAHAAYIEAKRQLHGGCTI